MVNAAALGMPAARTDTSGASNTQAISPGRRGASAGLVAILAGDSARQNQQQGQCKGRGRRQTERISKGRQGQKAGSKRSECIGSPGKHRETEYRGNAQNVSRCKTRGECKEVCVNEVQVW